MTFSPEIYSQIREGAQRSAARIVPLVYDLVKPDLVADVGCGSGEFAREFARQGCLVNALDESVGAVGHRETIDGARTFGRAEIAFARVDLASTDWWLPFDLCDLAVCLEVAEHLTESAAAGLVEGLTSLAPVVLWSAAIPGQTGHGHLNCQWPDYWAKLFYERGLVVSEDLRWEFWDEDEIEVWYRQNLLLVARYEWFDERGMKFTKYPRSVVHPGIWAWKL